MAEPLQYWRNRSDEELVYIAGRLDSYNTEDASNIRTECERRGLALEPEEADFPEPLQTGRDETQSARGEMIQAVSRARQTNNPVTRYRDSYRVARTINATGDFIKGIGIAASIGITVLFMMIGALFAGRNSIVPLFLGLMLGAMTWFVFWIVGILISATGEHLLAVLDGAVHSSPFMTDEQKREAMSLR